MEHNPENNHNTMNAIINDIDEMNSHSIQKDEAIVSMLTWIRQLAKIEFDRSMTEWSNKSYQANLAYESRKQLNEESKQLQDKMGLIANSINIILENKDTFDVSADVIAHIYIEMYYILDMQNKLIKTYNNIISIIEE